MSIAKKLLILQYPRVEEISNLVSSSKEKQVWSDESKAEIVFLVRFLEDRYIRHYDSSRVPLRTMNSSWFEQYSKYLQSLHYPFEIHVESMLEILPSINWLISISIASFYEEHKKVINSISNSSLEADLSDAPPEASEAVLKLVNEIGSKMHLPNVDGSTVEENKRNLRYVVKILQLVQRNYTIFLSASVISGKNEDHLVSDFSLSAVSSLLDSLPVGFDAGPDKALHDAAAILRVLYTSDLRQLQDNINVIIELLQSFTADTVVDTKRGVVGR
jgi:RNA transcription, translation and transport factor protein